MNAPAESLHPVPHRAAVAREALRAVGASVRLEMAAVVALMAGLMAIILLGEAGASSRGADYDVAEMTWPVLLLGLFAPLAVWKSEEPARRAYMWSMPVDRFRHTLMKVASGWAWLMGLVALFVLWAISIPLLTGGHIVINPEWEAYMMRSRPAGSLIRDMTLAGHAWLWVVPFVTATVGYLVGTAIALVANYPLRVYAGVAFTLFVTMGVAESVDGTLEHVVNRIFQHAMIGRFGLATQATGMLFRFDRPPVPGSPVRDMPDLGAWLGATAVWGAAGLIATLLAARRYQER